MSDPKCIDLFCGAGGLSLGFVEAGFTSVASNDFDEYAAETVKTHNKTTVFIDGKIQDITPNKLLKVADVKRKELDCLIGGPPCQAYSVYNHQRGMHDERSGLFREYLRLVEGLLPKFIVMENVTGIQSIEDGFAVKEIVKRLSELGYSVDFKVLKAEDYGVPQERRRIFFVANRIGIDYRWPTPTHGCTNSLFSEVPFVTVDDAISDLPALEIMQGDEITGYCNSPKTDYQRKIRANSKTLFNHVAPSLAPINLQRLKYIKPGGSWRDIPVELLPAGMKRARRCDHTKRYGRLHPNGLASTILTKCDPHWGAFIHPTQDRPITVREAARLQSFPDRIRFCGPRSEQYRQVGNAVPPILAAVVAKSILACLETAKSKSKVLINAC